MISKDIVVKTFRVLNKTLLGIKKIILGTKKFSDLLKNQFLEFPKKIHISIAISPFVTKKKNSHSNSMKLNLKPYLKKNSKHKIALSTFMIFLHFILLICIKKVLQKSCFICIIFYLYFKKKSSFKKNPSRQTVQKWQSRREKKTFDWYQIRNFVCLFFINSLNIKRK